MNRSLPISTIWLPLGIVLAGLAYSVGLPGDYAFDDAANLFSNPRFIFADYDWANILRATFSTSSGPLGRPVSMFSFALNQYLSHGLAPLSYKITNIVIHLVNAILVYLFFLKLLSLAAEGQILDKEKKQWISAGVAALWVVHPLNLTSVLYIVQRMTSLSATFMLLAGLCYLYARQCEQSGRRGYKWIAVFLFFPLYVLSIYAKESGVLLPLYLLVAEIFVLKCRGQNGRYSLLAICGAGVTLALPAVFLAIYLVKHPALLSGGYALRPFSMLERLLSEVRIVWFYLSLIFWPDIREMALFHDDIRKSTGVLQPVTTLISIIGFFIVVVLVVFLLQKRPRVGKAVGFGAAWYLCGHLLESTVIPLELVFEHRNYIPMLGPLFSLVWLLSSVRSDSRYFNASLVLLTIVLSCAFATAFRAGQWRNMTDQAVAEAINHPESSRANYQLGRVLAQWYGSNKNNEYAEQSMIRFRRAVEVDWEGRNGGYFGMIHTSYQMGRDPEKQVITELAQRLSISKSIGADIVFLTNLAKCQIEGYCHLKDMDFFHIAEGYLANPLLSPTYKANIYSTLGAYAFNKIQDVKKAETYFEYAVELAPAVERLLDLAEFYRVEGRYAEAISAIERARVAPGAYELAVDIDRSYRLISESRTTNAENR